MVEYLPVAFIASLVLGSFLLFRRIQTRGQRATERYLRAIIQTEPECVTIVSPDGTLLDMNPAGLRMIEADSLAEVQGLPVSQLLLPEHRA